MPVKLAQLEGNEPAHNKSYAAVALCQSLTSGLVSWPCIFDKQSVAWIVPFKLLWSRRISSKPVKLAQLEGKEPGQHRQHAASTLSLHLSV